MIGAHASQQVLLVNQRCNSLAERVRGNTWYAEFITDFPPLLAKVVGVAKDPCRRWKDYSRFAKVRTCAAVLKRADGEARQGIVRWPASVLVSSVRCRPTPTTRTTFPVTAIVSFVSLKSVHRKRQQLGAAKPGGD